MTEPIRFPVTANEGGFWWKGHAEITPDLARQIVALADVFGEENWQPLEKRIAALEAQQAWLMQHAVVGGAEDKDAQPTAQGDEAAVVALMEVRYCNDAEGRPPCYAIPRNIDCAKAIIRAIRDGKVPGIGDHLFSGRLVPKLEAEIARLKADLAAEWERRQRLREEYDRLSAKDTRHMAEADAARAQVAALAGLLRKIRPHIPHNAIDREKAMGAPISECYLNTMTEAALAVAGEGKP